MKEWFYYKRSNDGAEIITKTNLIECIQKENETSIRIWFNDNTGCVTATYDLLGFVTVFLEDDKLLEIIGEYEDG